MKRLTMTALILIALTTGAFAHVGSIGLYTDTGATDCDATFTPYVGADIYIMYYSSDSGPDGITAAEFKLEVPAGQMVISSFTPTTGVLPLGLIDTGIACSFTGCTGAGNPYTLIGTVNVLPFVATPVTLKILGSENLMPGDTVEPRVSMCDDPERTIVGVLGGWYSSPDGSCNVGTESKSWGAIKGMYKD